MSKYYTPEIEEFHIGFEYEQLNVHAKMVVGAKPTKHWRKEVWTEDDLYDSAVVYNLNMDTCRVKYLDREDIENLGFEHTGRTIDDWYELKVSRPAVMSAHTNRRYVLMHDFRTNQGVVIMAYDYESGDSGENTIYRGSCKNKSELKKLMKQLGI